VKQRRERDGVALRARVMDGTNLSGNLDNRFMDTFTNFGILMCSDAEEGTAELYRTLRGGGGAAIITTWERFGYMHLFQEAQQVVKPDLPKFKELLPVEWLTKAKLKQVMEAEVFRKRTLKLHLARFGWIRRCGGRGWKR
jgi:hypothetical protein